MGNKGTPAVGVREEEEDKTKKRKRERIGMLLLLLLLLLMWNLRRALCVLYGWKLWWIR